MIKSGFISLNSVQVIWKFPNHLPSRLVAAKITKAAQTMNQTAAPGIGRNWQALKAAWSRAALMMNLRHQSNSVSKNLLLTFTRKVFRRFFIFITSSFLLNCFFSSKIAFRQQGASSSGGDFAKQRLYCIWIQNQLR